MNDFSLKRALGDVASSTDHRADANGLRRKLRHHDHMVYGRRAGTTAGGLVVAFLVLLAIPGAANPIDIWTVDAPSSPGLAATTAPEADPEAAASVDEPAQSPGEAQPTTPPATVATVPPLELAVTGPANDSVVEVDLVMFHGTVTPGATVTVAGAKAAVAEGEWFIGLPISEGTHELKFVATRDGATTSETVVVHRVVVTTTTAPPPPPPPPPEPAEPKHEEPAEEPKEEPNEEPVVEWSANQKYGSCDEDLPYDKFYGTAPAGTKIIVESPYGSGFTYADDHGEWFVRVEFPEAPPNEPFEVWVHSEVGEASFRFVWNQPELVDPVEELEPAEPK